jgi:hypothetical protein
MNNLSRIRVIADPGLSLVPDPKIIELVVTQIRPRPNPCLNLEVSDSGSGTGFCYSEPLVKYFELVRSGSTLLFGSVLKKTTESGFGSRYSDYPVAYFI